MWFVGSEKPCIYSVPNRKQSYVIGDMTQSMRESAESRSLTATQDNEGYFGYNPTYGAYIEVISYDKLLKNAKQRNRALFDKLFAPKASDLKHPENLQNS